MVGKIKWTVAQGTITKVETESIDRARSGSIEQVFSGLQVEVKSGEEKTFEAFLHIQDISDFFLKTIQPRSGKSTLPNEFVFAQNKLLDQPFDNEKKEQILPILHISSTNLIEDNYKKEYIHIPRFAAIMESSIWNYYFCFKDYYELATQDAAKYATEIVQAIISNHIKGYYNLAITHEYADLNARLAFQSYICDQKGHGKSVSPFIFHSERKMKQRYEEDIFKEKLDNIRAHSWRILLVDDKWDVYLSLAGEGGKSDINKYDILKSLFEGMDFSVLKPDPDNPPKDDKPHLFIDCVADVQDAIKSMGARKYDIILLDYLLDLPSRVEYGYEVLTKLKVDKTLQNLGPQKRNFFMFISAFTTAVDERLLAASLTRSEDYWYISEGACPTNTPEQFKFYVANLMWKRLDDSGIKDLSAGAIYRLLNDIYRPKEEDKEQRSVRKRANENYNRVLSLLYHYHRLLGDVGTGGALSCTSGSVLVTEFMTDHPQIGGLLEHLVQLVHITAFGTVRQWPEMWEEYLYCKAQFDDYTLGAEEDKAKISKLYQDIERHILSLHSL